MDVGAGNRADHVDGADLARRRLVEAGRIAHRSFDQVVEDGKRDVDEKQARDRLVDPPVVAQSARQHDPQSPADHAGAGHAELYRKRRGPLHHQRGGGGEKGADQKGAFAPDDDHAELCGQGGAERGQDQGGGTRQGVLPREPGAERALVHVEVEIERVLAKQEDEQPEHSQGGGNRRHRNQDEFDLAAVVLQKTPSDRGRRRCSGDRILDVSGHEVAPITPSTK